MGRKLEINGEKRRSPAQQEAVIEYLYFLKNISRCKPYLDKILYQPINIDTNQFKDSIHIDKSSHESFSWKIENAQRSHIDKVLKLFEFNDIHMKRAHVLNQVTKQNNHFFA